MDDKLSVSFLKVMTLDLGSYSSAHVTRLIYGGLLLQDILGIVFIQVKLPALVASSSLQFPKSAALRPQLLPLVKLSELLEKQEGIGEEK